MRIVPVLAALVAMLALALPGNSAQAQNARSWVASYGLAGNPCTRASPCQTFNGALAMTNPGGEINCIDQGEFGGSFLIDRSVTVDCDGVQARIGVASPGAAAVVVEAGASDIVTLRGLDIDGNNVSAIGIDFAQGAALHVEKCVVRNFVGTGGSSEFGGIVDFGNVNSELFVSDTVVTNNGTGTPGAGILIAPAMNVITKVTLSRLEARGNFFGIKVAGNSSGGVIQMTIRDSVSSGNASNGIVGTGTAGGPAIIMMIDRSTSSHNAAGFGVIADGPKTTIRLGGSSIAGNINCVGVSNGGVLQSYGT
ncbi:MAG: hypothetical protein JOZ40_10610, partial [Methylobacteriaceae bacterium]|nr:hypothetical protein [Methylobacteriaceae bacterium]